MNRRAAGSGRLATPAAVVVWSALLLAGCGGAAPGPARQLPPPPPAPAPAPPSPDLSARTKPIETEVQSYASLDQ
jgi:PBP1b-binding outer membrane lipoprotein LpoB